MGRSSREAADENRTKIVEAASRMFRRSGVDAVSISDVMKEAGMTQGGFYKHFGTKEELAAEACSAAFGKTKAAWAGLTDKNPKEPERVSDLVDFYLTPKPADRTCPMVAFSQDAAKAQNGSFPSAYAAGIGDLFSQFDSLSDASGSPEDRERNLVLFAAMVGANVLSRAGLGGLGLGRNFKDAIVNFAGTRKPPSPPPTSRAEMRKKTAGR
jgi:TetR/AcrR family transcriptional repressor of nem operon